MAIDVWNPRRAGGGGRNETKHSRAAGKDTRSPRAVDHGGGDGSPRATVGPGNERQYPSVAGVGYE